MGSYKFILFFDIVKLHYYECLRDKQRFSLKSARIANLINGVLVITSRHMKTLLMNVKKP